MFDTNTIWFEIAFVCALTAFGTIFLGHFEERASKTRRALKLIFFITITVILSSTLGRIWAFGFLGICLLAVLYIHAIFLPRKGINGWTGEPKEKYYKLSGWKKK